MNSANATPASMADASGVASNGNAVHRTFAKLKRVITRSKHNAIHVDWRGTEAQGPIYAIGDVHGSLGLMEDLLRLIRADVAKSCLAKSSLAKSNVAGPDVAGEQLPVRIVFLGDVINRGPDSSKILDRLVAGPEIAGEEWLVLRGNHEQSLLDALHDDGAFERFLMKGGAQTMQSYQIDRKAMTRKRLRNALPKKHFVFLHSLPLTCRTHTHLFVHAGLRPGRKLKDQLPAEMMNLREPFFSHADTFRWIIVHGHTPTAGQPFVARKRIGVDTGACMTGILTAAVIDADAPPRFLSTVDDA